MAYLDALHLRVECDPWLDAYELLSVAYERLAGRHGCHCRELEHDIEALRAGDGQRLTAAPINLDAEHIIIPASEELISLVRRSRELGLIP